MCRFLQSLGQQSTLQFPPQQRRSNLSGTLRKHFRLIEVGLHVCRLYYVSTPDSHISPEHQLCKTFLQPTYNIYASEHNSASALVTVKIAGDEPECLHGQPGLLLHHISTRRSPRKRDEQTNKPDHR